MKSYLKILLLAIGFASIGATKVQAQEFAEWRPDTNWVHEYSGQLQAMLLNPRGTVIYVTNGILHEIDARTGEYIRKWNNEALLPPSDISPDGTKFISEGDLNANLLLYGTSEFYKTINGIVSCIFLDNQRIIGFEYFRGDGAFTQKVAVIQIEDEVRTILEAGYNLTQITASKNGKYFATAGVRKEFDPKEGDVEKDCYTLWDAEKKAKIKEWVTPFGEYLTPPRNLAIDDEGKFFFFSNGFQFHLYSIPDHKIILQNNVYTNGENPAFYFAGEFFFCYTEFGKFILKVVDYFMIQLIAVFLQIILNLTNH